MCMPEMAEYLNYFIATYIALHRAIICEGYCSDPTRMGQVSVLKCHPWIDMLTHTVLEDL